jgi:hypothetical protein
LTTSAAQAATINLIPNRCNNNQEGCTTVTIEGDIEATDGGRFMELMLKSNTKKALIMLHSDGGNLTASLQIGRYIKNNSYSTYVPSNAVCASGRAAIWLAGAFKQADATAKIGFHAAYTLKKVGRQVVATETGQGNAVVGAYYAELGYSEEAIRYFTKTGPTSVTWLSSEMAQRLNIQVKIHKDDDDKKKS